MNPFLEQALDYARRGWAVLPLRPGEKLPLLQDWPKRATTDEATIRRWWAATPRANIGVCAGASALVIVDLDVKNGQNGPSAWAALKVDNDTVASQTASGGLHLFYAAPEGFAGNRRILEPGIEILAGRSYAVLPPSVLGDPLHSAPGLSLAPPGTLRQPSAAGGAYEWLGPPETTRLAPFPQAVLERLVGGAEGRPALPGAARPGDDAPGAGPDLGGRQDLRGHGGGGAYARAALERELANMAQAQPGARNDTLNRAAYSLGRLAAAGSLERGEVEAALLAAALAAGLGEREARATIASGLRAGAVSGAALPRAAGAPAGRAALPAALPAADAPGAGPDRGGREDLRGRAAAGAALPGGDEQGPPLLDYACLEEELGRDACPWLDAYVAFSQTWSPRSFEGFHEACAIWLLSTVAARRVVVSYGGERHTNLYLLLAGRTTLHAKSSATGIAWELLRACSLDYLLAADEATPQAFVRAMAGGGLPEGYDRLDAERQAAIKLRLGFSGQRGWYAEEFGSWLASMVRTDGVMADFRGLLRKLDDCPPQYSRSTIARGDEVIDRPYLALIGNLTPADLRPLARRGAQLWGDGFLARFAFVTPPAGEVLTGEFPREDRAIPAALSEPLVQWHRQLGLPRVQIDDVYDAQGKPGGEKRVTVTPPPPQVCRMSDEVWTALHCYNRAMLELAQDSDLTDLDGNYGRQHEKALRVAALLASMENEGRIELRHWARAQAMAERWRLYTHRLYAQVTRLEQSAWAEAEAKIVEVVRRWQGSEKYPEGLTASEIARFTYGLGAGEVRGYADQLVQAGALGKHRVKLAERYTLPTAEGS